MKSHCISSLTHLYEHKPVCATQRAHTHMLMRMYVRVRDLSPSPSSPSPFHSPSLSPSLYTYIIFLSHPPLSLSPSLPLSLLLPLSLSLHLSLSPSGVQLPLLRVLCAKRGLNIMQVHMCICVFPLFLMCF
jgi:hypothetical protein